MKRLTISTLSLDNVLNKLQKGETIYFDNKISYKMVNNILCRFEYDKCTHINENLSFEDGNHYYFLEKEPLKLEVGKHYKTRRGTEAICYAYDKCSYIPYKFIELNTEVHINTYEDGKLYNTITNDLDIVDYWKD